MDVSIVIVSYNVSSFLDQALSTVMESSHGMETEVFVVDNASSDNSVEMVRIKYPGVNLISNPSNVGFARANNLAIEKCTGKYVLLLNPDTVIGKDTLRVMTDFLDSQPEAGAAGCRVLNPDGSLQLACRRGFPTPGVAFWRLTGFSGMFPKSKTFGAYNMTYLDPDLLTEVDAVSGSFMMLRKDVLDMVGYLDEDYFMYGEDLDLCWRIKQAGYKIFYVPYTEIIHFKGESTKKVPVLKSIGDFYNAMEIFVKKNSNLKSGIPTKILLGGIYLKMGLVYMLNGLRKASHPALDLILLNFSLLLGTMVRFGVSFQGAPDYSDFEWGTVFFLYSFINISVFFLAGMYHRYRYSPAVAAIGVTAGFILNVFCINFLKIYNFSRLTSFYSWVFGIIFIPGWRVIYRSFRRGKILEFHRTLVVGSVNEATELKNMLAFGDTRYDIIGCVESTPYPQMDIWKGDVHVVGFLEDLHNLVRTYDIDTIIMIGLHHPFSRILRVKRSIGLPRISYKLVPELKMAQNGNNGSELSMIEIRPGEFLRQGGSI
jgi:GT2 family glycosyltransferase